MEVYLGTIQAFAFNFVPYGWAACNGQLLPVNSNAALFSLLGTQFGGNGIQDFGLPNLAGRVPLAAGAGAGLPTYVVGEAGGSATTTLTTGNLPAHTHPVAQPVSASPAATTSPVNTVPAIIKTTVTSGSREEVVTVDSYGPSPSGGTAAAFNTGPAGANQPLSTQNPFLAVNFCIAITGIFPTRQ